MPISKTVYQIKVMLIGLKLPIWRRIVVADTTTLSQLHDILQTAIGWEDYHLHMFTINEQIYGDSEDDEYGDLGTKDEARFKLNQVVGREGAKFRYEYDFGDSWEHQLIVEKILPAEKCARYPVCIGGKNACPPEDVGGIGGYAYFLEAIADPKHPEHDRYLEWVGGVFDPEHFDLHEVNNRLRDRRHKREAAEQDFYQTPKIDDRVLEKIAAWADRLTNEQIARAGSLAVRRDMVTFLNYLKENRVTGTQSTGNLPLKAVREICAQFVAPPILDETIGDRLFRLRSEEDIWPLFYLHMLAYTGGLANGGQSRVWKVTSAGDDFLTRIAPLQVGHMLFIWWYLEDWRIAFPVSGLSGGMPEGFNKNTLASVLELPTEISVPYELFADRLVKETRMTWPIADQDAAKDLLHSAIERMVIFPLAGFGVIESEYRMEDIGGYEFSKLSKIRLTRLGRGLLESL